jgi:hypothetical protein
LTTEGSGVSYYRYRYRIGHGSWSAWLRADKPGFTVYQKRPRAAISVEIEARDVAGHMHRAVFASLTPLPPQTLGELEKEAGADQSAYGYAEECGEFKLTDEE